MTDDRRREPAPAPPPLRPVPTPAGVRIAPPPPDQAARPPEVSLWPAAWLIVIVFLVLATIYAVIF